MFRRLATAYPDKFAVRVTYNDELAHKIEAGADMFLMPSRYEPCGLNQIYSLRYGTIPIVRATGGLDDTIDDRNGFKFHEYSGSALLGTIRIALRSTRKRRAGNCWFATRCKPIFLGMHPQPNTASYTGAW